MVRHRVHSQAAGEQRASRHVRWLLLLARDSPETMPRYATHSTGSPLAATAVELRRCDAAQGAAWVHMGPAFPSHWSARAGRLTRRTLRQGADRGLVGGGARVRPQHRAVGAGKSQTSPPRLRSNRSSGSAGEEVGFEAASTLVGRPRSWAARCCACNFFVPVVTATARPYPQTPDAVRTEPGPAATRTDDTRPPAVLSLRPARRTVHGRGPRRGRSQCSAGSDERWPGVGARVVGLSSTSSMTSTRPAGIGPCMSPGRMGICPSDGWGVNILRALLR
jgi:hypothetical protein